MGGKDKPVVVPHVQVAPPPRPVAPPPKLRPLLEAKRRDHDQRQQAIAAIREHLMELEQQASKDRSDLLWLADHPEAEDIFTPDFLARFAVGRVVGLSEQNQNVGKEVESGQEKETAQGSQAEAGR